MPDGRIVEKRNSGEFCRFSGGKMQAADDEGRILELYVGEPLLKYSIYTQGQVETLRRLGSGIRHVLDDALLREGVVDAAVFREAYPDFWLWTLGAYEVVRTMVQAGDRGCLSTALIDRLTAFKRRIAQIRMPFAKQELQGEETPVDGELSVSGFSHEKRDVRFTIQGTDIWMRDLIMEFDALFDSVTLADVLADHRTAYSRK